MYPTEQVQSIVQPVITTNFEHFRVECKISKFQKHGIHGKKLCRQNNQPDTFKIFSAFESSIMAFGNIFGNNVFLMNTVLFKFRIFAIKPEVCEMGENFRLQNRLILQSRQWPSGQRPKRCMLRSQLDALYIFQSL